MFKTLLSTIFAAAAIFALGAVRAGAQDSIEAKVQVCAACHGQNGVATDPKIVPTIWGQQVSYLVKQLHDYRNGMRENPIMTPIAKSLQLADIRPIAAYFAAKSWPAAQAAAAPASPPNGIATCRPCHQPNFEGGPPAPRLAGLSYEYLLAAMNGFAHEARVNNGDMPEMMKALSDSERDAIARYLAGL